MALLRADEFAQAPHEIDLTDTSQKLQKKPLSVIMPLVESSGDDSLTW
jgi:hypothetical protein